MMFKLYSEITVGASKVVHKEFDNENFSFRLEETKDSIKGVFIARKNMTMSKFILKGERDFDDDDLFYANGYQAWTTSREFSKHDKFDGLIKVAKVSKFTAHFAGLSGDYHFEKYGEEGKFHGYTYCYFREKGEKEITLYGSKSERKGYTLFEVDMKDDDFNIKKDVEGLTLKAGQEYEMFDIA
ncbi:MAG: hypothetical protein IIX39_04720, partial [Clostridia bacterium]|nr:hypothetical protein [Clostridia bacterium]